MEGGHEHGDCPSSCLMSFGDTNNLNTNSNNNNNNNIGSLCLPPPPATAAYNTTTNNNLIFSDHHHNQTNCAMMLQDNNHPVNISVKSKIMSHPHYPRLLSAYLNCQKVGAPPEVVERLEEACRASMVASRSGSGSTSSDGSLIGQDPPLDQFMEAYCEMLIKYEQELSKPFKEAMVFLSRIESQFRSISISTSDSGSSLKTLN